MVQQPHDSSRDVVLSQMDKLYQFRSGGLKQLEVGSTYGPSYLELKSVIPVLLGGKNHQTPMAK